jgi:hypothetical protein
MRIFLAAKIAPHAEERAEGVRLEARTLPLQAS